MSILDVYIGDLDDPIFKLEDWNGNFNLNNSPKNLSGWFPPDNPFWEIIKKIDTGEFKGNQTDYGCWVAVLTGKEINAYVAEFYKDYEKRNDGVMRHLADKWLKLEEFVKTLDDNKEYGLVAYESC